MKRALQAILVAGEDGKLNVINDVKKITIREGHRDYTVGPVLVGCHILNWAVMRNITQVRYTQIKDLTIEECRDDGAEDCLEMLKILQQFYPNITLASDVTVIRWE